MKNPKKTVSLRLSDITIKELADLAQMHKVSQADVVAVMVHWLKSDGEDTEKLDDAFETAARI